mmetsp:Transcript_104411/g.293990  ORF Transcript_104411/g.293990 Transcript_104411/m.293990 type:complete len:359 (+) Transcript_104411:1566-2642(+)
MASMASARVISSAQVGKAVPDNGGDKVTACASPRTTTSHEKPMWPCKSRTRCHVSRPAATDAARSFTRRSSTTSLSTELIRHFRLTCWSSTAATSAADTHLLLSSNSARWRLRAAKAASGNSSGAICRSSAVPTPKARPMAFLSWQCVSFCLPARSTVRTAARSASRSWLWCRTCRMRFATPHNVGAGPPALSKNAAKARKGRRAAPPGGPVATASKPAETTESVAAPPAGLAQAASASWRRRATSQVSSSTSSASSEGSSGSSVAANFPAFASSISAAFFLSSSLCFFSLTVRCSFFPVAASSLEMPEAAPMRAFFASLAGVGTFSPAVGAGRFAFPGVPSRSSKDLPAMALRNGGS